MKFQKFELFPTTVIKFNFKDKFTQDEIITMTDHIDVICDKPELMQFNDLTPKYQSRPFLFNKEAPPVWQKLKETFLVSCNAYLKEVDRYVNNIHAIEFTDCRAWFYKGWKSLNLNQTNPWHGHVPSFLSGIFYLKVPDVSGGGTSFMDPRLNECKENRNVVIEPTELCWVIFPGWMYHQSQLSDSEEPRYVIAADSYVKVRS